MDNHLALRESFEENAQQIQFFIIINVGKTINLPPNITIQMGGINFRNHPKWRVSFNGGPLKCLVQWNIHEHPKLKWDDGGTPIF